MTKLIKIEYLLLKGIKIKYHKKLQKTGYLRLYVDEIEGISFTTSSVDQGVATRTLEALYWSHKLQEGAE